MLTLYSQPYPRFHSIQAYPPLMVPRSGLGGRASHVWQPVQLLTQHKVPAPPSNGTAQA